MTRSAKIIWKVAILSLAVCLTLFSVRIGAYAAEQPPAQQPQSATAPQDSGEKASKPAGQEKAASSEPHGIGGELARETRAAEGEEEENSNLKHSAMVQKFGKLFGLNVHQAHLAALWLNFAIIAFVIFYFARKGVPRMLRKRSEAIQRALEEARAASQEANRRLADIENRLRQMDVEIGRMQASAEKEAEIEEARIQKAAEEEIRKVVQAAEQEIAAAAKQARRELSTHTADLAIALARKQINVDSNTDQVLVRNFASKLASHASKPGDGGEDGR